MGIRDIEILIEENNPEVPDPPDPPAAPAPSSHAPFDSHMPPLDDVDDIAHLAEDDPRRREIERWAQQPGKTEDV